MSKPTIEPAFPTHECCARCDHFRPHQEKSICARHDVSRPNWHGYDTTCSAFTPRAGNVAYVPTLIQRCTVHLDSASEEGLSQLLTFEPMDNNQFEFGTLSNAASLVLDSLRNFPPEGPRSGLRLHTVEARKKQLYVTNKGRFYGNYIHFLAIPETVRAFSEENISRAIVADSLGKLDTVEPTYFACFFADGPLPETSLWWDLENGVFYSVSYPLLLLLRFRLMAMAHNLDVCDLYRLGDAVHCIRSGDNKDDVSSWEILRNARVVGIYQSHLVVEKAGQRTAVRWELVASLPNEGLLL